MRTSTGLRNTRSCAPPLAWMCRVPACRPTSPSFASTSEPKARPRPPHSSEDYVEPARQDRLSDIAKWLAVARKAVLSTAGKHTSFISVLGLSHMRCVRYPFSLLIALAVVHCSGSPNGPSYGFSLRLNVKDSAGKPVPGLRVSAWYHIFSYSSVSCGVSSEGETIPASHSVFGFQIPKECHVDLALCNLQGERIETLVADHVQVGSRSAVWAPDPAPVRETCSPRCRWCCLPW